MLTPPRLKPGDSVAMVATGKKITRDEVSRAVAILESWGLKVKVGRHLVADEHGYLAASDEHRLSDLQWALDDPEVKAILCARGGYGTSRIVDRVDYKQLLSEPKWVVGFSDVTSLHLKLMKVGLLSIHSTMPILFTRPDAGPSLISLRSALFEDPQIIQAATHFRNKPGASSGKIVGGNLSLVIDSLGTSSQPHTTDCILVLEEIDDYMYRIDRAFNQLKRAGLFANLSGLVIGYMTDLKDADGFRDTIEDIVLDKVKDKDFPVCFGFPIGHESPNFAWIHGSMMELSVSATVSKLTPVIAA